MALLDRSMHALRADGVSPAGRGHRFGQVEMAAGLFANGRRSRSRGLATPHRAFTLFEVAVVISLLVLLAGLMWPAMDARIRAAELPESADNIRSMLRMARASAALTGQRFRIRWEKDVQQPHIEYQVDAVRDPTKWEACQDGWACEPILLGDVQVHHLMRGRPEYMMPISHTLGSVGEEFSESITDDADANSSSTETDDIGFVGTSEAEEDVQEERPTIVFEIDGSVDWHTIVLARVLPEDELNDEERQVWIVLDGRTGLPLIQEQLTEEQMGEIARRPDLDKLQPPQLSKDDLEITTETAGEGDPAAGDGELAGQPGLGQGDGQGDSQAGAGMAGADSFGQGGGQRRSGRQGSQGNAGSNDDGNSDGNEVPTKSESDGMNNNDNGENQPEDQSTNGRRRTSRRGGQRSNG